MAKINATVLRETRYIAVFSLVLSILMQAVFLICRQFNYTVILGNLLGFLTAVGNFFFMGLGVQKAVEKDEKGAKSILRFSQTARFFGIFIIAALGIVLECFNTVAVIVPLFFPRIAIAAKQIKSK